MILLAVLVLVLLVSMAGICFAMSKNKTYTSQQESTIEIEPFASRVSRFWSWFEEHRAELESVPERGEKNMSELVDKLAEGMQIIGDGVYFNVGNRELTFCVEENTECYYLYPWLVESMPESLRETWTVYPCKQPENKTDFDFGMFDKKISVSDILVSAEYNDKGNSFDVHFYHPVLSELTEDESVQAFYIILELIIGEGTVYNYIDEVKPTDKTAGMMPIGDVAEYMKSAIESHGQKYYTEPFLPWCTYQGKPVADSNNEREDIISGASCYMDLNREYLDGDRKIYDALAEKGAVALMLILNQPEGMETGDFLDLKYAIQDHVIALLDQSIVKGQLIGSAYGTSGRGYIDLLLYDEPQFLEYISNDEVIGELLNNCRGIQLSVKGFTRDSAVRTLR